MMFPLNTVVQNAKKGIKFYLFPKIGGPICKSFIYY